MFNIFLSVILEDLIFVTEQLQISRNNTKYKMDVYLVLMDYLIILAQKVKNDKTRWISR